MNFALHCAGLVVLTRPWLVEVDEFGRELAVGTRGLARDGFRSVAIFLRARFRLGLRSALTTLVVLVVVWALQI
jgi:hypothetical protein